MKKAQWTIHSHAWPSSETIEIFARCSEDKTNKHHFRHEIKFYDIDALIRARTDIKHQIHLIGFTYIFDLTKTLEKRWLDYNQTVANESEMYDHFRRTIPKPKE